MKSKLLALSAISAGLVAISLTIGAYLEIADLCALVISSVFVTLPLYYKSYKGSFLCALAGGIIAFMISGFNVMSVVFPSFVLFFGLYPIVKCFMLEKHVRKWIQIIIGAVWFIAIAYGMYFYYTLIMGEVFNDLPAVIIDNILYIIAPIALGIYFLYDKFIMVFRLFTDKYIARIIK